MQPKIESKRYTVRIQTPNGKIKDVSVRTDSEITLAKMLYAIYKVDRYQLVKIEDNDFKNGSGLRLRFSRSYPWTMIDLEKIKKEKRQ